MKQGSYVVSVIYPGVEKYLDEFVSSFNAQTNLDFTMLILNDGLDNAGHYFMRTKFRNEIRKGAGTPASLRLQLIQTAVKCGAKQILFADADDTCSDNRVAVSKELLENSPVVFNKLMLTFEDGERDPTSMFGERFEEGQRIDGEFIRNKHCLGLSNTAIRTDCLNEGWSRISEDTIAFDWAFFGLILDRGNKATFTKRALTFYRQHGNNIASPGSETEADAGRGIKVKKQQYTLLSKQDPSYAAQCEQFKELDARFRKDPALRLQLTKRLEQIPIQNPMWWEKINFEMEKAT